MRKVKSSFRKIKGNVGVGRKEERGGKRWKEVESGGAVGLLPFAFFPSNRIPITRAFMTILFIHSLFLSFTVLKLKYNK